MIFASIYLKKNQFCSFVVVQDHGNIFLIDCFDGHIRLNYLIYNHIECLLDKLNTLKILTFSSPNKHFFFQEQGEAKSCFINKNQSISVKNALSSLRINQIFADFKSEHGIYSNHELKQIGECLACV